MNKAIFLDKDGTLIPDIPYNVDPALITISEHSIQGLQMLQQEGYLLIVVSNQSGVALGMFDEKRLADVERELRKQLNGNGISLAAFYYCPHHPNGEIETYAIDCECRKPLSGMLLKAAKEHGICLDNSWMIGDILNDVEAGNRAGCNSILINNGNETEWLAGEFRRPFKIVDSINDAAELIHEHTKR